MNDLVKHLHNTFLERCRANERYSLRAFARSLNLPPSTLSEIINGKRPLTKNLRDRIGLGLNLSFEEIKSFRPAPHGNSTKKADKLSEVNYQQLSLDSFYVISEWYHYGILQLIKTKSFVNDHGKIAKRLGIQPLQAKLAIERLKRVGILEVDEAGNLIDVTGGNTSHLKANFTSEELKSFQVRAMEKASVAIKKVPIKHRDNTSMTMAISKKAMPFAKEEIKKFRRELTKKLEAFSEPDEVYQLIISLTPITEIEGD